MPASWLHLLRSRLPAPSRTVLGLGLALGVLAGMPHAMAMPTDVKSGPPAPVTFYRATWGDRTLTWNSIDFRIEAAHGATPLFALSKAFAESFDPNMTCTGVSELKLLSVVGPFASVYREEHGNCTDAMHSSDELWYQAFDMRKAQHPPATTLDQVFPPDQILHALLRDKLVKIGLAGKPAPTTLPALVATLSAFTNPDCTWGFSDDLLTRFAFHHLEGNRVAVRLGLSEGCQAGRGHLTQIGILLPIPSAWRTAFEEAAHGKRGFLTVNAPKGLTYVSRTDKGYKGPQWPHW